VTDAPPTLAPVPGSVLVVALYDGDALPSEIQQLERFLSLVGQGRDAQLAQADDAERTAASAWLDSPERPTPESWSHRQVVVVLRFAAPQTNRAGRRVTSGLRDVAVLKPGASEPNYHERVEATGRPAPQNQPAFSGRAWGQSMDALLDRLMGAA